MAQNQSKYDNLPISLQGSKLEVREHICSTCGHKWNQDCGNARQWYKKVGNRLLCRKCKSLHGTRDKISVMCSRCGKSYFVHQEAIKSAQRGQYQHLCSTCCQLGKILTNETKSKISTALKGRKLSQEHIENIRSASKISGRYDGLLIANRERSQGLRDGTTKGIKWSKESIRKRSEANRGKKRSSDVRARMSISRKEYLQRIGGYSKETRHRIAVAITKLRASGYKPESGHIQETYMPSKPCCKDHEKKKPYVLSSSWESTFARWLDHMPKITSWTYEPFSIPLSNGSPYLIDFMFVTQSGDIFLVEVKPMRKIAKNVNRASEKWEALQSYCTDHNLIPYLVTEHELKVIAAMLDIDES